MSKLRNILGIIMCILLILFLPGKYWLMVILAMAVYELDMKEIRKEIEKIKKRTD